MMILAPSGFDVSIILVEQPTRISATNEKRAMKHKFFLSNDPPEIDINKLGIKVVIAGYGRVILATGLHLNQPIASINVVIFVDRQIFSGPIEGLKINVYCVYDKTLWAARGVT